MAGGRGAMVEAVNGGKGVDGSSELSVASQMTLNTGGAAGIPDSEFSAASL